MRRGGSVLACMVVCAAVVAALVSSCRDPTELTVTLTTDVKCSDLRGTSVTVGRIGELEAKAPTTSSTACDDSGDLGSLVIVPSGANDDDVSFRVVAGLGRDVASCAPPYGKGCIVARREIHFLPHGALRVGVPLRASCDGIPCGDTETCVRGACTPATIGNAACTGADGCGEGALTPAAPQRDAGVDAAPVDAGRDSGLAPPTPGVVACAVDGGTCSTTNPAVFCCDYGDAGTPSACMTNEGACPVLEVFCDEQADCKNGNPCCLIRDNAGPFASAFCYPNCFNPPQWQGVRICKSDAECDGGPCLPIFCTGRWWGTCGGAKPPQGGCP